MKANTTLLIAATTAAMLAGCASSPSQHAGCAQPNYGAAVIGGLAGGLLGAQVGAGSGRVAAAAVGAGTGAVIGSQVGCH